MISKQSQKTSVTFDRRKIVSCQCSCSSQAEWCSHVVALCLHRIHLSDAVELRAPVSESLSRLDPRQLQKFAQYLIAKLPEQILPVAQSILDDLLSTAQSDINLVQGAPDPTLGGAAGEHAAHCLDSRNLKDNIKKILVKFCVPAPIVFSDVNYLTNSAPPSAAEWCSFLRPLRGREPEGMWNLLSIVREMYRRDDRNSIPLLEVVTQQCLETNQIMLWWFNTKVALQQRSPNSGGGGGGSGANGGKHNVSSNAQASQNACASLCDEIVALWKLAALNPCISPAERDTLKKKLVEYHITVVEKVQANQGGSGGSSGGGSGGGASVKSGSQRPGRQSDLELFSGFKPAIEACSLGWKDYPIAGVTFGQNAHYLCPFFRPGGSAEDGKDFLHPTATSQVNCSEAVLRCEYPGGRPRPRSSTDGNLVQDPQQPRADNDGVARPAVVAEGAAAGVAQVPPSRQESAESSSSSTEEAAPSAPPDDVASVGDPRPALLPQSSSEEVASDEGVGGEEVNGNGNGGAVAVAGQVPQVAADEAAANADGVAHRENGGSEDYSVYYYDTRSAANLAAASSSSSGSGAPRPDVFRNLRETISDSWEVLFMRAEGIHAHGYKEVACSMAVELARHLLSNPPDLIREAEIQKGNNNGVAARGEPSKEGGVSNPSSMSGPKARVRIGIYVDLAPCSTDDDFKYFLHYCRTTRTSGSESTR